jgi:hypothetical protein
MPYHPWLRYLDGRVHDTTDCAFGTYSSPYQAPRINAFQGAFGVRRIKAMEIPPREPINRTDNGGVRPEELAYIGHHA